jgi:predicted regulator of amino acid metabolism with ACT domain
MMGGIDTGMPDKIVKRVINEILVKAGLKPVNDDMKFIKKVEKIASVCGYRPIELCWMT